MIPGYNRLVQPIFKKITGNEKDKKRLDKSGWLRYNINTCFLSLEVWRLYDSHPSQISRWRSGMSIISGPRENSLGGAITPYQIVAKSESLGITSISLLPAKSHIFASRSRPKTSNAF